MALSRLHSTFRIASSWTCTIRLRSTMEVTKNLTFHSLDPKPTKILANLQLQTPTNRPMVILLSWMLAKKKHINKFVNIYKEQGFDVLTISISPWQLLWPTKGAQIVAGDVLKFLEINQNDSPLVVHGFSVGGYVWGEVLVKMTAEKQRYEPLVNRIAGQIWDSVADVMEIPIGLPFAVFPKNEVLQAALKQYILYHLKAFDKAATCHYFRASQMFHTTIVRAPALFLLSKTDPVGSEAANRRAKENWENMGMDVEWMCWDRSPHVGHFRKYPDQYVQILYKFLDKIQGVQGDKAKLQAKL